MHTANNQNRRNNPAANPEAATPGGGAQPKTRRIDVTGGSGQLRGVGPCPPRQKTASQRGGSVTSPLFFPLSVPGVCGFFLHTWGISIGRVERADRGVWGFWGWGLAGWSAGGRYSDLAHGNKLPLHALRSVLSLPSECRHSTRKILYTCGQSLH